MTRYPDLFEALAAPFADDEVKVRNESGRSYHYITARTAMNRLDTVLGPENWWDEYVPGENSVLCRLSVRLPDGRTLTKSDAGGYANMKDQGDDDKSGFSDAFKRTCVKFGIARYLYRDGVPDFRSAAAADEPAAVQADRPAPPPVSQPEGPRHEPTGQRPQQPHRGGVPRDGRALYKWAKDRQEETGKEVFKWLQSWGKLQDYPPRVVDWNPDQVANGWDAANKKLEASANGAHAS